MQIGLFIGFSRQRAKMIKALEGALRCLGGVFLVGHQKVQKFRFLDYINPVDRPLDLDCG
jgi:hypothetical protein